MGVGGHFWDLLKPYARLEGFNCLRNKRVAVDLSYWIIQHETAIKSFTRKPHLRLTFLRTINLFAKFGAFPVFVTDGTPSPLKSQARIMRFYRASGIDLSNLPQMEEGISVERNKAFQKCVQECMELLELLGMPVLKATGEAEALCAQLNREGHVSACITADSDAFLYGAKCVIKRLQPNCKEPFECYYMSDIEANLGLTRNHLIAISLLVGNDHDLNGVQGIGLDSAVRFVKSFNEHEILDRLREIGRGDSLLYQRNTNPHIDFIYTSPPKENMIRSKTPHCTFCGHLGSKKSHQKIPCELCKLASGENCTLKPVGFKCNCSSCDLVKKEKEENWQRKICTKIASEHNFPNNEIIKMLLSNNNGFDNSVEIRWENPKTEMLCDFLSYNLQWEPCYTRQRMLTMFTTLYLRNRSINELLCGQYEFDLIQRVKIRYNHELYVIKWKKSTPVTKNYPSEVCVISDDDDDNEEDEVEDMNLLDEPDVPLIKTINGCTFINTDEDLELVQKAFPEKVEQFLMDKERREMKLKRKKVNLGKEKSPETPRGKQLSITEFYNSTKVIPKKPEKKKKNSLEGKRKEESSNYSKSARRKLLFD